MIAAIEKTNDTRNPAQKRPTGFSAMEKTVLAALAMLPLSGILLLTNGLDGLATRWL